MRQRFFELFGLVENFRDFGGVGILSQGSPKSSLHFGVILGEKIRKREVDEKNIKFAFPSTMLLCLVDFFSLFFLMHFLSFSYESKFIQITFFILFFFLNQANDSSIPPLFNL